MTNDLELHRLTQAEIKSQPAQRITYPCGCENIEKQMIVCRFHQGFQQGVATVLRVIVQNLDETGREIWNLTNGGEL